MLAPAREETIALAVAGEHEDVRGQLKGGLAGSLQDLMKIWGRLASRTKDIIRDLEVSLQSSLRNGSSHLSSSLIQRLILRPCTDSALLWNHRRTSPTNILARSALLLSASCSAHAPCLEASVSSFSFVSLAFAFTIFSSCSQASLFKFVRKKGSSRAVVPNSI